VDQARIRHRRDHAVGQDAIGAGRKREAHGVRSLRRLQMPKNKGFYRLSDGRLDGKGVREYSMTYPVVI
jgi:hypothetical protein